MNRKIVSFAVAVLLVSTMGIQSFAGSHHIRRAGTSYPICTTDNCVSSGVHSHQNTTYQGHAFYCTLDDCTETGTHSHNGVSYSRSLNQCTVGGCALTQNHLHDGVAFCHNGTATYDDTTSYNNATSYRSRGCGSHHR